MSMIRPITPYVALIVEGLDTKGQDLKIKTVCVRCLMELSSRTYSELDVNKIGVEKFLASITKHAVSDALEAKAHGCPLLN